MSATIDQRIVEMQFQNSQFEKGVGESLSTIDKLKKALNFDKTAQGMTGISDAARKFHLGPVGDAIESISSKFSAMGIVGVTALMNITNAAISAGTRMVKALTIDPIMTGMNEYETKLNSVQTILANTQKEGTNLDTVTKALNELNAYSDKTIYNFQQMARNVGTFTAAGVKLDTSVAAIKGIANLAAVSGSNADQASTAMYQLSQALSTGTVKLMDWNSVVNAGMGGQVFQDAIMETARVHGIAIDDIIKEEGSFRDSLQKGWFTSEILTETLQKFTGDLNADQLRTMGYSEDQIASIIKLGKTATDAATKVKTFTQLVDTLKEAAQSGWAQSWEIVVGDFEEAKSMFTEINNTIGDMLGKSAATRNALLQAWKDLGGRNALIDSVKNTWNALMAVVKPIQEAFREIFPPMTAQTLYKMTVALRDFTAKLTVSGETADKIKRVFKGIFAIFDIVRLAIAGLAKALFGLNINAGPALSNILDFLAGIGDWIVGLRDSLKATDGFRKAIEKLFTVIVGGVLSLKKIDFSNLFKGFAKKTKDTTGPLAALADRFEKVFEKLKPIFDKLAPMFIKVGDAIAEGVSKFMDKLSDVFSRKFKFENITDLINTGLLAAIVLAVKKFLSTGASIFEGVADIFKGVTGILTNVSGILDAVRTSIVAYQANIKAKTLMTIAIAIGILAASIIALSFVDPKKLAASLGAMAALFTQLTVALLAFTKTTNGVNPMQMTAISIGLIGISVAMLLLASALAKIAKIDSGQLLKGLVALTILIGIIRLTANQLGSMTGNIIKGALGMIIFSFALKSFAGAVKKLGEIDTDTLTKGLISVGVLMTELALFMRATDLSKMGLLKSVGILLFAQAMNMMVKAVAKLADIKTEDITKGIVAMGVIFTEVAVFNATTGGGADLILAALGMDIIAASIILLAQGMTKMADISWEGIAKGLIAMGVAMTEIGVAAYLIPPTLPITALGMLVMAQALVILAKALDAMGMMSWEEIGRGLAVMAGSLLILSVAMIAMTGATGGAIALMLAAAALNLLAPPLKALGMMDLKAIGIALLAMAGVFLVLGVAGAVMGPTVPILLGLGAAMLLIGVAAAAAGVGMLAFSAGLGALAVSGAAGGKALAGVMESFAKAIPALAKGIGKGILALVDTLVKGAPTMLEGLITLLNTILDGLKEVAPKLIDTVLGFIDKLLKTMATKMPSMVEAGYKIILAFLQGIQSNIASITGVVTQIFTTFMNAMSTHLPELAQAGWNFIIKWIDALTASVKANLPKLMDATSKLGWAIVEGLVKGLFAQSNNARDAIINLGKMIIAQFKKVLGIASPSTVFMTIAKDIINGLVNGIKNGVSLVVAQFKSMGTSIINAIKSIVSQMASIGRDVVMGLVNGIKNNASLVTGAIRDLVNQALNSFIYGFQTNSPSEFTTQQGKYLNQGLALGISKYTNLVVKSVEDLADDTLSAFSDTFSKMADAVNVDPSFQPTITPVVDLTNVEASGKQIDSIFGAKSLSVSLARTTASGVASAGATGDQTSVKEPSSVVSFTQNNYSPKELSRIDIYRQTKNLITQAKGQVGAI